MAIDVRFSKGPLTENQQQSIGAGFENHSLKHSAPAFKKDRINWLAFDDNDRLIGGVTADVLWDWIYIDELWIDPDYRNQGIGKQLMDEAEAYAISQSVTGLWLWTQSWQAPKFYNQLGYKEFARFDDFPKGHARIGFRKHLSIAPA